MKKVVKKYGKTLIISFTKDEERLYNIGEGDVLDLSDIINTNKHTISGGKNGTENPIQKS